MSTYQSTVMMTGLKACLTKWGTTARARDNFVGLIGRIWARISRRQKWNANFLPFALLVFVEFLQTLGLILHARMVYHDGLFYFLSQYFFLNHTATGGDIPQWNPFVLQGTTAAYWYGVESGVGLLFKTLLLAGPLIKNANYLDLFYWGIFVDKLVLLTGVWLLAQTYYSRRSTVFFVAVSVMASGVWMTQVWFNFHAYYLIPLILYFIHRFFDSKRWRYGCLTVNLFVLQCLDKNAYFIATTSLVTALYIVLYLSCRGKRVLAAARKLNWRRPFLASVALSASFLAIFYVLLQFGVDKQMVLYHGGRNLDGSVALKTFLSYGGFNDFWKWLELPLGFSLAKDYTLYLGILPLPFLGMALVWGVNKKSLPIVWLIVILLLLSVAAPLAVFFYYAWPLMKFYRHLSLLTPFIRVFLCFLAGFGFEAFISRREEGGGRGDKVLLGILTAALAGWAFFLWVAAMDFSLVTLLTNLMVESKPLRHVTWPAFFQPVLENSFRISAGKFLLASLILGWASFVPSRRNFRYALVGLLVFHFADLYVYSFYEAHRRTIPLTPLQYQALTFRPLSYSTRRVVAPDEQDVRYSIFSPAMIKNSILQLPLHAFLMAEQTGSAFHPTVWQRPLDFLLRAYGQEKLEDRFSSPKALTNQGMVMPLAHPAARKFSGIGLDKIQFFSQAHVLPTPEVMARVMTSAEYKGDVLFLLPPRNKSALAPAASRPSRWLSTESLSQNERLNLPYEIKRFDADHLTLDVTVPADVQQAWMFFSDVWHPGWRATVNAQPVPVYQASLAYKAVPLRAGLNHIQFYFYFWGLAFCYRFFGINAFLLLVLLLFLMGRICFGEAKEETASRNNPV